MPVFVMIFIWLIVAALYVMQVSPELFRWRNASEDLVVPLVGIGISVFGLLLESVADRQKSSQKKENPGMVATRGLYRLVRCPNYLGEILFWTGVFVSGLSTYRGAGQWIFAVAAYVSIVFIMFNGAQRMEKRQMKQYGHLEEYREYADRTPIILPFLPIYHLNRKEN
jgi:steroid 5-alpha reductase family enzyme